MLKFALYAVLAYLLLRAVANLLRAMRQQDRVGTNASPHFGGGGQRGDSRSRHRKTEGSDRATRLRDEEDVEDARWEDV